MKVDIEAHHFMYDIERALRIVYYMAYRQARNALKDRVDEYNEDLWGRIRVDVFKRKPFTVDDIIQRQRFDKSSIPDSIYYCVYTYPTKYLSHLYAELLKIQSIYSYIRDKSYCLKYVPVDSKSLHVVSHVIRVAEENRYDKTPNKFYKLMLENYAGYLDNDPSVQNEVFLYCDTYHSLTKYTDPF